ncbi:MAG: hypothetical protein HFJ55_02660 [Clostridia bacterium]|nr:hypothetical protein [Clostridia bacterium]
MNIRQHAALFFWAMLKKGKSFKDVREELPYTLLPDSIRGYVGTRQPSHFEVNPNGETAWMKFPEEEVLLKLTKGNFSSLMEYYIPEFPKAAIGELTNLEMFDAINRQHQHYRSLRAHFLQDRVLDEVVRRDMVDESRKFEDVCTIKWNGEQLSGQEIRSQLDLFCEASFLRLVGMVYENTGFLINRDWCNLIVRESFERVYPLFLVENTFKYFHISDEMEERINSKRFELTQEEISQIRLTDRLEGTISKMHSRALQATYDEL